MRPVSIQVGQGQRRDRRDSRSADRPVRPRVPWSRMIGTWADGESAASSTRRAPENDRALAQPPEGRSPARRSSSAQPARTRTGPMSSAQPRSGRRATAVPLDRARCAGKTSSTSPDTPTATASARPPGRPRPSRRRTAANRRAAPDAFDDHGGRQHGSQDRQAPPAGRVDRAGAQQDAAEHREAGEETQNGSGGPDGRGRPGPSWRRQGRRRLRHPPFDRRHLGTSRRAPVASAARRGEGRRRGGWPRTTPTAGHPGWPVGSPAGER